MGKCRKTEKSEHYEIHGCRVPGIAKENGLRALWGRTDTEQAKARSRLVAMQDVRSKKPTIDDMEIKRLVFTKISGLEKHPEIINAGVDTASMLKYNDIDPENREYATKQILEALQAPLTGRDKENYLFRQAVFKVLLGEKATVQLKLKNGQII